MIITRISGGLGNQMFQYAIARSMAERNNDAFKLDLSFYPQQTLRKYELGLFNIKENIATEQECVELRGKEGLLYKIRKKLSLNTHRPVSYMKERQNTVFDDNIYSLLGNAYLDGFWQNEKYFTDIKAILLKEFTPKESISTEAENHARAIETTDSISLHVRRGDYVADAHTNSFHGLCDLDYYKRAIEHINAHVEKPVFYIFSDDIVWCKENFDFLDNKVFVSDTKTAIDDLELMRRCKHNIIANSSFSWWGAWLNINKAKIVISPINWINNNTQNLKWVPDTWLQL